MTRRQLAWAFGVIASVALGCQTTLPPDEARAARAALEAWFECEECSEDALAAVLAHGDVLAPSLAAVLEHGLSPTARAETRERLAATYARRVAYAEARPETAPVWREAQYIAHHLANRDARHRSRAARALGRMGGPIARQALETAHDVDHRADVAQAIELALADLDTGRGSEAR